MRRCAYRAPWNPSYRCPKRTLGRLCLEHRLERLRWEHQSRRLFVSLNLGNMNRPSLHVDGEREWVSLSWGNGNSDPVWVVEWHRRRPVKAVDGAESRR